MDNGLEKDKLILGMPFYGQTFKLANANDNGLNAKAFGGATGGEFTKSEGFLSYYEVIQVIQTKLYSHFRIKKKLQIFVCNFIEIRFSDM